MTVYVDHPLFPKRGTFWAHLFSEDIEELHQFASALGLKRASFQQPPKASWPHYDVTVALREHAIRLGAIAADLYFAREIARRFRTDDRRRTTDNRG